MQQQKGDDSCRLYSMAVATALCNKQNPAAIEWNQALMWQHLLDCFEEEKMTLFPVASHVSNVKETIKNNSHGEFTLYLQMKVQAERQNETVQ